MKIEKSEISEKLKLLKNLTPPKTANTPITGVLFKNGRLFADNFEMSITAELETDSDEAFVIPTDAIDYIYSLPGGVISIEYIDKKVVIKSKQSKCSFSTVKTEDFSVSPDLMKNGKADDAEYTFDSGELFSAINSVIYACNAKSVRPTAKGILFNADGTYLEIVAVDDFRIAKTKIKCSEEFKIIIPKEPLQKALSLPFNGDISLSVFKNTITLSNDEYSVNMKSIVGDFLNYNSIFTNECTSVFKVDRKEAIQSFSRAVLCSGGSAIFTKLTGGTDSLNIHLSTAANEFTEDIHISGNDTEKILVAINPRMLIDCLKAIDSDKVEIRYIDTLKPVTIASGNTEALILPVRMRETGS